MFSNKLRIIVNKALVRYASVQQSVKPPIQLFGIEGRYATALYTAAIKKKNLENVESDLNKLQSALTISKNFLEFMENPAQKQTEKNRLIKMIGTEFNLAESTNNFLSLLVENRRLTKLKSIINSFKIIMSAHRGEINCEITTATPMEADQEKKLENVLKSFTANKTIKLKKNVDPSIMGGMILLIGDKYVDMSIATKVKKYSQLVRIPA